MAKLEIVPSSGAPFMLPMPPLGRFNPLYPPTLDSHTITATFFQSPHQPVEHTHKVFDEILEANTHGSKVVSIISPPQVMNSLSLSAANTETIEGMKFDTGYISPYFITNQNTKICEMDDPLILFHEKKILSINAAMNILEFALTRQRPVLIIAEDMGSDALETLIVNKVHAGIAVCAVKAPGNFDNRKSCLQEFALLTGGEVMAEELGLMNLVEVESDKFGSCNKVVISKDSIVILNVASEKGLIKEESKLMICMDEFPITSRGINVVIDGEQNGLQQLKEKLSIGACYANGAALSVEQKVFDEISKLNTKFWSVLINPRLPPEPPPVRLEREGCQHFHFQILGANAMEPWCSIQHPSHPTLPDSSLRDFNLICRLLESGMRIDALPLFPPKLPWTNGQMCADNFVNGVQSCADYIPFLCQTAHIYERQSYAKELEEVVVCELKADTNEAEIPSIAEALKILSEEVVAWFQNRISCLIRFAALNKSSNGSKLPFRRPLPKPPPYAIVYFDKASVKHELNLNGGKPILVYFEYNFIVILEDYESALALSRGMHSIKIMSDSEKSNFLFHLDSICLKFGLKAMILVRNELVTKYSECWKLLDGNGLFGAIPP